jgi:ABC-type polysaccharide/polyol phosphate transport system ATPase subunit
MSNVAVRVQNLGKEYRIGGTQQPYKTFRDSLTGAIVAPFQRMAKLLRGQSYGASNLDETFWALRDISFEVKHGEVVGIIGPNGAGKSTLLKILSRITEPTEGYADVYGRVGSLLEVGTGFHPELTGRENIYLNGAILGMSREEIDRKFAEIVAFAEIERFIDTPVKHYSSGMGLRLGFAVAVHLEPEILIVDEVLAVGDAEFQKKCLGKMGEVSHEGRTVLFVSHNMAAVQGLCQRVMVLEKGKLVHDGDAAENILLYLSGDGSVKRQSARALIRDPRFSFSEVYLTDSAERRRSIFSATEPLQLHLVGEVVEDVKAGLEFILRDTMGTPLTWHAQGHFLKDHFRLRPGKFHVMANINGVRLSSGVYSMDVILAQANTLGFIEISDALRFEISICDPCNVGFNYISLKWPGKFFLDVEYNIVEQ